MAGLLAGLAVAIILWLISRREDRKDHEKKLALIRRQIRLREEAVKSGQAEDHDEGG
jgi:hypothetical protein